MNLIKNQSSVEWDQNLIIQIFDRKNWWIVHHLLTQTNLLTKIRKHLFRTFAKIIHMYNHHKRISFTLEWNLTFTSDKTNTKYCKKLKDHLFEVLNEESHSRNNSNSLIDFIKRHVKDEKIRWINEIWVLTLIEFEKEKNQSQILQDHEVKLQTEKLERKKLLRFIDDLLQEIRNRKVRSLSCFLKNNDKNQWKLNITWNNSSLWKQVRKFLKTQNHIQLIHHPRDLLIKCKLMLNDVKRKKNESFFINNMLKKRNLRECSSQQ